MLTAAIEHTIKGKKYPVICYALYNVRSEIKTDPSNTLRVLANIGFQHLQGRIMPVDEATEFRDLCNHFGLDVPFVVAEAGIEPLEQIKACRAMGANYLVIPAAPVYFHVSEDGFRWKTSITSEEFAPFPTQLSHLYAAAADAGIEVIYHLHPFDYKLMDNGFSPLSTLLADPRLARQRFEVDLAWLVAGTHDVSGALQTLAQRIVMADLKDFDPYLPTITDPDLPANIQLAQRSFPPGEGRLDLHSLAATCLGLGAQYLLVEHEPIAEPLISAKQSWQWLVNAGLVQPDDTGSRQ